MAASNVLAPSITFYLYFLVPGISSRYKKTSGALVKDKTTPLPPKTFDFSAIFGMKKTLAILKAAQQEFD
ncbi:hypothetical protein [Prochlorococcus marinus]|uniref:hypothetical protein n=1 Tax=Prochlorococcus marinus TaxID=1219 RepID=UPI0022B5CC3D|nr:hypothetical protein [Prochlorococcus marinus]